MNTAKNDMTKGAVWKLITLFAIPVMLGNLLQQFYSAVDGIIVGKYVGEAALSSIGTSSPVVFLFNAFAVGLGVGASVITSQFFGANKRDEIPLVIDTALILSCITGVIISAIGISCSKFLLKTILNVPDNLLYDACLYLRIYCSATIFTFIYNAIASVLRGLGDSRATLYFLLVSTILNVFLDLLFVAVFKWSVTGAAVATGISQAACAGVSFLYLRKRIKANNGNHFDKSNCLLILKLGIPAAIQQSIVSFGHIAMQRLVNGFGNISIAAYTVGNKLDTFVFVPIQGMTTALSNFTGQNVGAGRLDRVKTGLRFGLVANLVIAVVLSSILYIFASPIVGFFSLTGPALARGVEQVRFFASFLWLFATYMSFCGVLQGSGDVIVHSIISFTTLGIRVLLGYIGVWTGLLGYESGWVTMPVGWFVAIVLALLRYFGGKWKNKIVVRVEASE